MSEKPRKEFATENGVPPEVRLGIAIARGNQYSLGVNPITGRPPNKSSKRHPRGKSKIHPHRGNK